MLHWRSLNKLHSVDIEEVDCYVRGVGYSFEKAGAAEESLCLDGGVEGVHVHVRDDPHRFTSTPYCVTIRRRGEPSRVSSTSRLEGGVPIMQKTAEGQLSPEVVLAEMTKNGVTHVVGHGRLHLGRRSGSVNLWRLKDSLGIERLSPGVVRCAA